jgi:hypothetical protein
MTISLSLVVGVAQAAPHVFGRRLFFVASPSIGALAGS